MNSRVLRTHEFVRDAVALIVETGREALARSGMFRLGLAGGGTPRAVYKALAENADALPWEAVQITFGDERCVPPDHADSNFHMASEALLSRVPIPAGNVFLIQGNIAPDEAAAQCEARLAAVAKRMGEDVYRHDLLLLGLGEDGHTASLFPGSPALAETQRLLVATIGPKPPPQRVTFTYPLINASRRVAFLLNDPKKEPVLEAALRGEFPSGGVRPTAGEVVWVVGS
jgi:6-phosphogluconolactonase